MLNPTCIYIKFHKIGYNDALRCAVWNAAKLLMVQVYQVINILGEKVVDFKTINKNKFFSKQI